MNAAERQALREKHQKADAPNGIECGECMSFYPCDVIKVLDAWEEERLKVLSIVHTYDEASSNKVAKIFMALGSEA